MSISLLLTAPEATGEPAAADAAPVWTDPYDDGDPHYLPADELVEPAPVPGWAYRRVAR